MYLVYLRKIDLFLATDGFSDRSFAETTVDTAKVNNAIFHENWTTNEMWERTKARQFSRKYFPNGIFVLLSSFHFYFLPNQFVVFPNYKSVI